MSRRNNELLEQVLEELLLVLREYRRSHKPSHFSLKLTLYPAQGEFMSSPITGFPVGTSAQLVVVLLANGVPYVAPAGAAPYTFQPTVSDNDSDITVSAATVDVTGGVTPLSQQFLLTDLPADPAQSFSVTSGAVAPDGSTLSQTATFTLNAVAPTFSQGLTLFPAPGAAPAAAQAKRKIPNE